MLQSPHVANSNNSKSATINFFKLFILIKSGKEENFFPLSFVYKLFSTFADHLTDNIPFKYFPVEIVTQKSFTNLIK